MSSKLIKHKKRIKPSEVCIECGGFNDKYPVNSICKKCFNEKARIKYKKKPFEDDSTFTYWRYCTKCKELKSLLEFDGDNHNCDECLQ